MMTYFYKYILLGSLLFSILAHPIRSALAEDISVYTNIQDAPNLISRDLLAQASTDAIDSKRTNQQDTIATPVPPILEIAGLHFQVLFDINKVPSKTKHDIINDLNLIFKHYETFQIIKEKTPKKLGVNNKEVDLATHTINFGLSERGNFVPETLREVMPWVSEKNGVFYIIVDKKLLSTYEVALYLIRDRKVSVDQLRKFIFSLNLVASDKGDKEKKFGDFFYVDHLTKSEKNQIAPKLEAKYDNQFKNLIFKDVSILTIRKSEINSETKGMLTAETLVSKKGIKKAILDWPMVLHNGEWRLVYLGGK